MSEQRQEGFWWVRWAATPTRFLGRWEVVEVTGAHAIFGDVYEDLDDPEIEWGPFIGTGPIEHMVHAASRGVSVGLAAVIKACANCPTCDQPIAGDEDYAKAGALAEEHGHDHAVQHFSGSLCWTRFGQPCQPYDWRGECLRLRADKKAMGDTIDRLRRESSMEWHRERDL